MSGPGASHGSGKVFFRGARGTHTVFFDSPADTIELTHTARSRQGFASGAVHALENLVRLLSCGALEPGRLYGMADVFPGLF